jgi:acyl carrier protein
MSVRAQVLSAIEKVAVEQKKMLPPLTDDLQLEKTGFDSLCFAILVARLEDSVGVDPFSAETSVAFPVTVGDFVALYDHAAG